MYWSEPNLLMRGTERTIKVETFYVSNVKIKNQCYVAYKDGAAVLVDPAWDYSLVQYFLSYYQLTPQAILLTHSHFDHTNLAQVFAEQYDIPVYMSKQEIDFYSYYCSNLVPVEHLETIYLPSFQIIPIQTPGHTTGSTCYLLDNHVFSGDTVFIEGVGICAGRGSDPNQMYDSIQLLKRYLSSATHFWPGHSFGERPGKDLNYLLKNNIYLQFERRQHFVSFRMRRNQPDPFDFR